MPVSSGHVRRRDRGRDRYSVRHRSWIVVPVAVVLVSVALMGVVDVTGLVAVMLVVVALVGAVFWSCHVRRSLL